MEELLVASFTGDPAFEALEPQIFEDAVNKNQIRVLCYQKNGKVDVFKQPGGNDDRSSFVIGGM